MGACMPSLVEDFICPLDSLFVFVGVGSTMQMSEGYTKSGQGGRGVGKMGNFSFPQFSEF